MSKQTYMEAIGKFGQWLDAATASSEPEPTAMSIASSDPGGQLSVRTVLLKEFDERGFIFYTNFQSNKGRQLLANPVCAACFHWKAMERQVLIEGSASPVSEQEADAYFASRPRGSQIGAWASNQSQPLASRSDLESKVAEYERRFSDSEVPRPPHWSGFRIAPTMIEFWQGQSSRLHDRHRYSQQADGAWEVQRLNP